jgi:ketosteroid isomerase-like protein
MFFISNTFPQSHGQQQPPTAMTSVNNRNIAVIREVYDSFQRKDVEGILKHLATDVQWNKTQTWASKTDLLKPRTGQTGAREYFGFIEKDVDIKVFDVQQILQGDNVVAGRVHVTGRVRSTGKDLDVVEIHWFRFNSQGQVVELQQFTDTAQVLGVFSKELNPLN